MLNIISTLIMPTIIAVVLVNALMKKAPVFDLFTTGAKDGFKVAIDIIPYLVALIVAISMFRASGAMDSIANCFNVFWDKLSLSKDIFPIMITRSLSGSATLGLFSELATQHGPNDFITKLAAVMVGSSETTFYILTVYFGSIGIKKFRYALLTGIIADITGIILAILVSRLFFLASIG